MQETQTLLERSRHDCVVPVMNCARCFSELGFSAENNINYGIPSNHIDKDIDIEVLIVSCLDSSTFSLGKNSLRFHIVWRRVCTNQSPT